MDDWAHADRALALFAQNPCAIGGIVVRMRAGPDRDRLRNWITDNLPATVIAPSITDDQLFGGIDLTAALAHGQVRQRPGLLQPGRVLVLTMAERCDLALAAKLAQAVENGHCAGIVALDEGVEPEEACPAVLAEVLAFHLAPDGRAPKGWLGSEDRHSTPPAQSVSKPRSRPAENAQISSDQVTFLTEVAAQFGIESLRAPTFALAAARSQAALCGRTDVTELDLETAAALVYPHRATRVPEQVEPPEEAAQPNEAPQKDGAGEDVTLPDGEMLIEAVRALLPPDLLAGLVQPGTTRAQNGAGAGRKRIGNRRGRPLPSRPGKRDARARIDLIATLRAAAPWQTIRRANCPRGDRVLIRPSDLRIKRFAELSDRALIFAVDASGSAAVNRLNEAKGAIELMLADAYAARDHVALVAFRGTTAEVLLPPTRSLVQTKRRLAALPGGGGTPLAAGLRDAASLATQAKHRGMTPTIVLLTDGRANITLDGLPDRVQAAEDATHVARSLRGAGLPALVIDAGQRPSRQLKTLAEVLDGRYLSLPRADAHRLSGAVSAALTT